MKTILTTFFLLIYTLSYSQNTIANKVNFESNSYEIPAVEKQKIKEWSGNYSIINIQLNGYTDNVGSETANLELSKKRVESVYDYLITLGINENIIELNFYGEINDKQDADLEIGELKNRRVDIILSYEPVELAVQNTSILNEQKSIEDDNIIPDAIPRTIDNTELFSFLNENKKVQKFKISVSQDTAIQTKDGLIFYFNKFSFETSCEDSVEINIVEYNSKSDIILGNIQTVSNGKQLYSVGMYDLKAFCNETEIKALKNNYTVLVPIESSSQPKKKVKGFYGYRDSITNEVNWVSEPYKNVTAYKGQLLCRGVDREPNKVCFLKRWFSSKKTKLSEQAKKEINIARDRIEKRYKNVDFNKMENLPNKDLEYYVFQPRRMGKVNCDIFWVEKESNLMVQRVMIDSIGLDESLDIKMVFKRRRSIISSSIKTDKYFEFRQVPKNESVYIVGLSLTEKKEIKLAIQEIKTKSEEVTLSFERIDSMEELERKLKPIN